MTELYKRKCYELKLENSSISRYSKTIPPKMVATTTKTSTTDFHLMLYTKLGKVMVDVFGLTHVPVVHAHLSKKRMRMRRNIGRSALRKLLDTFY